MNSVQRTNYPRPSWHPAFPLDVEWTVTHLAKYLGGKRPFCVYENGTCVAGEEDNVLELPSCEARLLAVVKGQPDFRVRSLPDGNFLVGFRGPVLGLVSGKFLHQNIAALRVDATLRGSLPGERLMAEKTGDDSDLIAGLYARARLYDDASSLTIIKIWPNEG